VLPLHEREKYNGDVLFIFGIYSFHFGGLRKDPILPIFEGGNAISSTPARDSLRRKILSFGEPEALPAGGAGCVARGVIPGFSAWHPFVR